MLLYLITILGSMAKPQASHQSLSASLAYCHTLVGHLLLQPALESVQALLLFSITHRLRDQLSQAWDVLTLANSMSQTLRLGDLSVHSQAIQQVV
jgi:predicted membrane chloride channel (bestrophin family)